MLPGGPLRHQVGVGDEHARRVGMGLEHAHRLAGLYQQGLVVLQHAQAGQDLVVARPVARGAADAAVDHQVLGVLRHLGVQIVLQHAVCRFGQPAFAAERGAAGCADHPGRVEARIGAARIGAHDSSLWDEGAFSLGCLYNCVKSFKGPHCASTARQSVSKLEKRAIVPKQQAGAGRHRRGVEREAASLRRGKLSRGCGVGRRAAGSRRGAWWRARPHARPAAGVD